MPNTSLTHALLKAVSDAVECVDGIDIDAVAVAFSGGLDSTVLLHLCQQLRKRKTGLTLSAVHINHGLSRNALEWEQHCQLLCQRWDIPLCTRRITITEKSRTSLEQQARDARYRTIEQALSPRTLVLLGQHQDDQAETFLLQLARGAGTEGLSAMAPRFASGTGCEYARPLLAVPHAQLREYALENQLHWVEDDSNINQSFYRNFVRISVMPVLQQKWPAIASTIARSAKHCADSAAVVDEYMTLLASGVINHDGQLNIATWQNLSAASQSAMLRFWLRPAAPTSPSAAVLNQIKNMAAAKADAQPECSWDDSIVRRYNGQLYVHKRMLTSGRAAPQAFAVTFDSAGHFEHPLLPYSIQLQHKAAISQPEYILQGVDLTDTPLRVEFGGFSRVCKLSHKRPSKAIKKWLQEMHIPPWERAYVPILMHEDTVMAVGKCIAINTYSQQALTRQSAHDEIKPDLQDDLQDDSHDIPLNHPSNRPQEGAHSAPKIFICAK